MGLLVTQLLIAAIRDMSNTNQSVTKLCLGPQPQLRAPDPLSLYQLARVKHLVDPILSITAENEVATEQRTQMSTIG
jgi:hypothetical protein